MTQIRQFNLKKFGYLNFDKDITNLVALQDTADFIKVVFVKAGSGVVIDFESYQLKQDACFFINTGQYYSFSENCRGTMLYYNRDFYCVEIHDKEVACDGILFNNVYEMPVVFMNAETAQSIEYIAEEIKSEIELNDLVTEEMLRTFLKQIIIKCTRLWKQAHQKSSEEAKPEVEFSRTFSQMVELNYIRHHTVAEYATLLHITPKALNKRITRYSDISPNDIIKNRIILEAKRLLVHTQLSVKEITYKLGYEDPSYFIRFFTKQTNMPPQSFRTQYLRS